MVDAERLHRILRHISDGVARLRRLADEDPDVLLDDEVKLGYLKYLLITTVEGCIDAAQHVGATEGFGPPDSNADAIRNLARHGVVDGDIAREMARAVGFRNLLVHGYADLDDRQVVAVLQRLSDIDRYVSDLARLIDEAGASSGARER